MKPLRYALLLLAIVACSKSSSKKFDGVPCDAKAIAELNASLDKANGIGVNLADPAVQKEIEAAKATVVGKKYTFTGCKFTGQGNDEVSFGPASGEGELHCAMKDGVEGVTRFRHEAMEIGQDKVKLDVRGELAVGGDKGFERIGLRNCEIAVHD